MRGGAATSEPKTGSAAPAGASRAVAAFVFVSGAAGLIYEVLWLKQLGLLFGNTAHASAATLAAFFAGLGLGNWWWGRRVARAGNILATYAALEAGILVSACAYFGVLRVFSLVYPWLVGPGGGGVPSLVLKFVLAIALVCPGAFFMGGTLPVISQLLVRRRDEFGRTASRLYGVNTAGAAVGAFAAAFVLVPAWGYLRTYLTGLVLTGGVALAAFVMSRRKDLIRRQVPEPDEAPTPATPDATALRLPFIFCLCFASGAGVLALEVLWTFMLSQVYMNTVYTFAAILVTTLLGLAGGAALASLLARRALPGAKVLVTLLVASGVAVCGTPFVFMALTDGMHIVTGRASWAGYMAKVFGLTFGVLCVPLLALGTVFPYLLKLSERELTSAGRMLGRLGAVNTAGAICGSLAAGFVLLSLLGLWVSILTIALLYLALAAVLLWRSPGLGRAWRLAAGAGLLVAAVSMLGAGMPPMYLLPEETLVEYWHGASGSVAVVENPELGRVIKVNGHYGLGATSGELFEKGQASIPLMLHPKARSVFFLGLGTGITAAEALSSRYGLERIVACEVVPEVVTAARRHFGDRVGALFEDPRCEIVVDDGRHYLGATRETFDIINSDLFLVYRKGVGSLYSLEHFRTVRGRLAPDGIFVLWLPLYQLTRPEFLTISRTMLAVFPRVTLWRNQFLTWKDTVALVAQTGPRPLVARDNPGARLERRREAWQRLTTRPDEANLLLYYCGDVSRASELFSGSPLNTDDRPVIEYLAPVSTNRKAADEVEWLAGPSFISLMDDVRELAPPESDPALSALPAEGRRLAVAGYYLARAMVMESYYERTGRRQEVWMTEAQKALAEFERIWLQP